jgi:hypothetical protein
MRGDITTAPRGAAGRRGKQRRAAGWRARLYPNAPGARFDLDYYLNRHNPNYTNTRPIIQISEIRL